MKSPSSHQGGTEQGEDIEQLINSALDQSADNLSERVLADLAQTRNRALRAGHEEPAATNFAESLSQWIIQPLPRVAVPVVAVVAVAVSLNYIWTETIPPLSLAMVAEEMPTEDLSLLEDLEFVTWLAENEQDMRL
ncbi:MAG: hypothetical protein HOC23_24825 [Halieaceae bacterium]|jgi:hypothetical protein|nr:hypothetical protein [Halieaceae bacterium]